MKETIFPQQQPSPNGAKAPTFSMPPLKNMAAKVVLIVLAVVLLLAATQCFYIINEQENAVVVTFGNPVAVTTPGLHFKIPFIQQVHKVDMTIRSFPIGYDIETREPIPDESLMITSDYNFVNVDFFVEYRATDPVKWIYSSKEPENILKTLSQSYIRDTIGMYPVDEVITTGKNQIQAEIKEKIIRRMEQQDIGIQLVNITIQDATPPTTEVLDAFKAVETAKQGKETAVNNANKYRSQQMPAAEAQADQIIQTAEAQKAARINEANGQVARFNSMYAEYAQYPLITKQRMFYEAMEEILPNLKVVIQDAQGNTLNLMSLDGLSQSQTTQIQQTTPQEEE